MPLFDAALVAVVMFSYAFLGLGVVWAAGKAVDGLRRVMRRG